MHRFVVVSFVSLLLTAAQCSPVDVDDDNVTRDRDTGEGEGETGEGEGEGEEGEGEGEGEGEAGVDCTSPITAPPSELGLDPFYQKHLNARGIPVVGSSVVSDAAVRRACVLADEMLARISADALASMIGWKANLAVMAETEVTTDIPEHADMYELFPGTDWDTRARGLGGTTFIPTTSCAEENVLCLSSDRYLGESILVHELAHTIAGLGVGMSDEGFDPALTAAFDNAMATGLWANTYATTNRDEYFAEGVQSYFDTNLSASPPNGIHNDIDTRTELEAYDPLLFAVIQRAFGTEVWTPGCP